VLLAGICSLLLISACQSPEPPPESETPSPIRQEFLDVAERLFAGNNTFFGMQELDRLRSQLAVPDLPPEEVLRLNGLMSLQLLRNGELEEAIERIDYTIRLVQENPGFGSVLDQILRARGAIYFRKGEVDNWIEGDHSDCCNFPIGPKGVHRKRFHTEIARDSLLAYLRIRPQDLRARWLLNIVYMTLDDWPDGVPEEYLVPPEALESEYDIGFFPDIAPQLGLDRFDLAGGSLVEDFDNDGFLDIITSSVDPYVSLSYRHNNGDGTFEDRTESSGLADQLGGLNCISGDYDNDGFVDVLVLRGAWLFGEGQIRNSLLHNNGDGTFTDVTRRAGLADPPRPTQGASWGDFDLDGDLDLYVANESPAQERTRYPSHLYRNNGDGTFTDIAQEAGVANNDYGKGAAVGDYDNDGDPDIYVSNIGVNRLFRNDGDMRFVDVAREAGVTRPERRSFATWMFDYNNDGWLDIFVAAYDAKPGDLTARYQGLERKATAPHLYRNNGDGTFTEVAEEMGFGYSYAPMGANFGDLDNDGWLDFCLATGDPNYLTLVPTAMLRNDRGKRFQDVSASGGFGNIQKGHGVSFADIDNDGDQDVHAQIGGMLTGDSFFNSLYLNPGHGNHFLTIQLVGTQTNRFGYGVRIKIVLETAEGQREIHRAAGSVASFGGSPARQEIGLGKATAIVSLEVTWPRSGERAIYTDVPLDSMIRVTEGQAEFERLPMKPIRLPG
jgi:hypothetical protein